MREPAACGPAGELAAADEGGRFPPSAPRLARADSVRFGSSLIDEAGAVDAKSHSSQVALSEEGGRRARLSRNSQPQAAVSPGRHSGLGSPLPAGRKFHAPRSSRAGRGRRVLRLAPAGLRHGIWLARLTVSGSTRPGDDSCPRPTHKGLGDSLAGRSPAQELGQALAARRFAPIRTRGGAAAAAPPRAHQRGRLRVREPLFE